MADGSERQVRLKIDAGGEQVELLRICSTEALSQHFSIEVDVLAPLGEIDWLPHLGKPVHVSVHEDDQLLRHFHGLVVDASFCDEIKGAGFHYKLRLRPSGFFHEQGKYFRIFQNKKVRGILEDMFMRCGIVVEFGKLNGGQRVRSYCVQYGESDFGFICRLMEEEGIYYFYKHSPNGHSLVLCDGSNSHETGKASPLTYSPDSLGVFNADSAARTAGASSRFIQTWKERVSTNAESKVTMRDFDFIRPSKPLEAKSNETGHHLDDDVEVYSYPGRFYVDGEGKTLAETVLNARRANRRIFTGDTKCGALECGTLFAFEGHPHDRFDGKYLLTHVSHSFATEQRRSGWEQTESTAISFEVVPGSVTWRAPMTTRRPIVAGPETAIVTGPPGETIHVDKYGRVCVQFHWDRDGKLDDKSSCWIRVSQTGGLGNVIIPRVGHEVLVDFINGDPDRPIVVGRVFNSSHMPTYPLPEHKTKAVWRTKRYGEEAGDRADSKKLDIEQIDTNEIRLDDKAGEEEFFMYAQRTMNSRISLDESREIGRDHKLTIHHDRTVVVDNNENIEVKEHRKTKIGKTDTLEIVKLLDTKVTDGDEKRDISGTQTIKVGKTIKITAGTSITLECGQSKIVMDATSIKITSITIDIEAQAAATMKSLNTKVDGTAMTTIKGGIVMIN